MLGKKERKKGCFNAAFFPSSGTGAQLGYIKDCENIYLISEAR